MKKKKRTWPFKLIFVLGFLILIYPQVSRIYYRVESTQEVSNFDKEKENLTDEEVKRRIDLAQAFNDSLVNQVTEDPYAKKRHDKGRAEYARMLELHHRVPYSESIDDNFILSSQREFMYKYMFVGIVFFIVLMLILIRYYRKKSNLLLKEIIALEKVEDEVYHGKN